MRNHARLDEQLAVCIPVHPPRVTRAVREDLKFLLLGLESPHTRVDLCALCGGSSRLADVAAHEDAVAAVEPAVRPPVESVERLVCVVVAPAIEEHLRLARRRRRVPIRHRHEIQIRRSPEPHAAVADFDAADEVQLIEKNGPFIEAMIAVRVLENEHAVLALALFRPVRVSHPFHDPRPSALIEAEGNRVHDVRLRRKNFQFVALRNRRRAGHFVRL